MRKLPKLTQAKHPSPSSLMPAILSTKTSIDASASNRFVTHFIIYETNLSPYKRSDNTKMSQSMDQHMLIIKLG